MVVGCFVRLPLRYCLVSCILLILINIEFSFSGFILEIIGLWDSVGADFKV